jgi:serine/threonine protein kinase
VDQIGSGGYGFVMSAVHRITKQEVAVKFIYKKKLPLASINLKEPLEISILKRIHHPTMVDFIDNFEDDTYFYLVMELWRSEWKPFNQE